ncbi:hypothetical protein D1AOALGA4SA_6162, partial [Olavius algarvensis Delta 1 endosymbiont]
SPDSTIKKRRHLQPNYFQSLLKIAFFWVIVPKNLPVKKRPKMVAIWGREYFSDSRNLLWLLFASIPGLVSAIYNALFLHRWGWAIFGLTVSEFIVVICFTALCSGMISSNWGTFFRDSEPYRCWIGITFIFVAYFFVFALMWFGK